MIGTSALIKLMILFFLDSKDYPIALSSVYGFFLGNYAEYFKLNETINTLITDGLIESEGTLDSTFLKLTNTGKDMLSNFEGRISQEIKEEMEAYWVEHNRDALNKVSISSRYYPSTKGDYIAELRAKEKLSDLINIMIHVPSREGARNICEHWKEKSSEIYGQILKMLL